MYTEVISPQKNLVLTSLTPPLYLLVNPLTDTKYKKILYLKNTDVNGELYKGQSRRHRWVHKLRSWSNLKFKTLRENEGTKK